MRGSAPLPRRLLVSRVGIRKSVVSSHAQADSIFRGSARGTGSFPSASKCSGTPGRIAGSAGSGDCTQRFRKRRSRGFGGRCGIFILAEASRRAGRRCGVANEYSCESPSHRDSACCGPVRILRFVPRRAGSSIPYRSHCSNYRWRSDCRGESGAGLRLVLPQERRAIVDRGSTDRCKTPSVQSAHRSVARALSMDRGARRGSHTPRTRPGRGLAFKQAADSRDTGGGGVAWKASAACALNGWRIQLARK